MTPLLVAILGPVATVVVALLGYFGFRALRQAQTRKTDAESDLAGATADKTTAEAWTLLTGGLTARLAALEAENAALRVAVAHAEEEARACRAEVESLRRRMSASEHREDERP